MKQINIRLSVMMFLQFFVWGGWFVTMSIFLSKTLSADGGQIAMAYSTQSWGAIIAPFIIGLIADRYFNAERIMGVLHLVGAFCMYQLSVASDFNAFYPYVLGYMISYMPTLALVNSVSFRQLSDPSKQFSFIRVWGTVGWIAAGWVISWIFGWDAADNVANGSLRNTFMMSAIASAVLGLYSFTLPATPPNSSGKPSIADIIGLDALKLLKDRNFLVFFLSSVLICIPLAFYYQHAGQYLGEINVADVAAKMSYGQISEVLFMLLLPFFFNRFGFKNTILVGMLAWLVRYLLFAFGDADGKLFMLIMGIVLHGICYDFFFVSGQIYTDSKAGEKFKSSAQGMITLATYGLGMLIGFWVAGKITDSNVIDGGHSWQDIWIFPAGFAAVVFVIFLLAFKKEEVKYEKQ